MRATFQITLDCEGQLATGDHQEDAGKLAFNFLDSRMRIFYNFLLKKTLTRKPAEALIGSSHYHVTM